ncbi:MAG: hypothetical protein HRU19_00040 [Pseudobacteriovorax sp.]|nr:hypothetical protein [Pseudobacteriovorax sp.]
MLAFKYIVNSILTVGLLYSSASNAASCFLDGQLSISPLVGPPVYGTLDHGDYLQWDQTENKIFRSGDLEGSLYTVQQGPPAKLDIHGTSPFSVISHGSINARREGDLASVKTTVVIGIRQTPASPSNSFTITMSTVSPSRHYEFIVKDLPQTTNGYIRLPRLICDQSIIGYEVELKNFKATRTQITYTSMLHATATGY